MKSFIGLITFCVALILNIETVFADQIDQALQMWVEKYAPDSYQLVELDQQIALLENQRNQAIMNSNPNMGYMINNQFFAEENKLRELATQWGNAHPQAAQEFLFISQQRTQGKLQAQEQLNQFWQNYNSITSRNIKMPDKPDSWYKSFGLGAPR